MQSRNIPLPHKKKKKKRSPTALDGISKKRLEIDCKIFTRSQGHRAPQRLQGRNKSNGFLRPTVQGNTSETWLTFREDIMQKAPCVLAVFRLKWPEIFGKINRKSVLQKIGQFMPGYIYFFRHTFLTKRK